MASKHKDIPVLTEVYDASKPAALSPEFFESVMAQLKTRIDEAIAEASLNHQNEKIKYEILDELRPALTDESQLQIKTSLEAHHQNLMHEMVDFVDKTKADLATEVPKIYHSRAQIFQLDITEKLSELQEQSITLLREEFERAGSLLQSNLVERVNSRLLELQDSAIIKVTDILQQQIYDFQEATLDKMRQDLALELPGIYQSIVEQAKQALTQQLNSLQEDASQELGIKMNETLPSIYALASMQIKTDLLAEMTEFANSTKDTFEAGLKGDLPELEQLLRDRVRGAFENELPTMRQEISTQVNAEIEAMIRSVRLVTSRQQENEV
jgi:hypothetical protein